jgi:hypothetical protein
MNYLLFDDDARPINQSNSVASHAALRICFSVNRCAEVGEIVYTLKLLDDAYNGLCQWQKIIDHARVGDRFDLDRPLQISEEVPLCLAAIETTAPAQVEIVGAQKPLARLRFYLQLERDTRAENFLVSCSSEIALLRGQNIPEEQIQAALGHHLLAHFQRLDAAAELTLCD